MKLTDCAQTDSAQRFCLDDRRPGPLFVQIILNPDRLYAYPAHLSPSSSVGHNAPLVLQCLSPSPSPSVRHNALLDLDRTTHSRPFPVRRLPWTQPTPPHSPQYLATIAPFPSHLMIAYPGHSSSLAPALARSHPSLRRLLLQPTDRPTTSLAQPDQLTIEGTIS
ncbi:hypothetical protein BC567DRAFT_57308 [Phyllosticta citribraziliensis]